MGRFLASGIVLACALLSACSQEAQANPAAKALQWVEQFQAEQDRYFGEHRRFGSIYEIHLHDEAFRAFRDGAEGYRFVADVSADRYTVKALPVEWGGSTKASYLADETGAVYGSEKEALVDPTSPRLK